MSDRITVHLDEATSEAELRSVAAEVAVAFDISREEALALLEADVIILEGRQAEKLVSICRALGVNGTLSKPPRRRSPRLPLRRNALPFLLGVLVTAFLVVMVALVPFSAQPVSEEAGPAVPVSIPVVGSAPGGVVEIATLSAQAEEEPESGLLADEATAPIIASLPVAGETQTVEETDELETVEEVEEAPSLFTVAREGSLAEVRELINGSLEVDMRDAYGQTPLMYAAGTNQAEVVTSLLEAGANVQAESDAGWTALMYAARNLVYPDVTEVLINAGADLDARNADGQSARDVAQMYNNTPVAGLLEAELTQRAEALEEREAAQTAAQTDASADVVTRVEATLPISVSPRPARVVTPAPSTSTSVPSAPAPSTAQVITVNARPRATPAILVDGPRTGEPVLSRAQVEDQRQLINNCLQDWESCGTD